MTSYENMETTTRPHEIFVENTILRNQAGELLRQQEKLDRRQSLLKRIQGGTGKCHSCVMKPLVKFLIICLIIVTAIIVYLVTQIRQDSALESLASATSGKQTDIEQTVQKCGSLESKPTFQDLDYALLGYNILKGFPLAIGHDPGFTYPIFKADYSAGHLTADCRYAVPHGLVVIPDVSCITTFSSTTIRTKYEFSRALSVYTKVSVGVWGNKFSASVGYKGSSSEISSGEYVFIFSTAKCNYYFSKLVTDKAPNFDDVFLEWIHKLNAADDRPELYFTFFETFGTHFATDVTFGARYTYEYKMSSRYYERQREMKVDVETLASSSGFFGLGAASAEFQFSLEQKQKMSEFRQSVETQTTTVGAPPPEEGGALAWASTVKTNPVPTSYRLTSIEELFTDKYMKSLEINYNRIYRNIVTHKMEYCLFLQKKGDVESCEDLVAGIELGNTRILGHYKEKAVSSVSDCIEICLQDVDCEAVSFCTTCPRNNIDYNTCHLIKGNSPSLTARKTEDSNFVWQSNVFPGKIHSQLKLNNINIIGISRGFETEEDKTADLQKCRELCMKDAYCSAYTYCNCSDKVSKCTMYSDEHMSGLQQEPNTDTFFLSKRPDSGDSTTTTPSKTG